ncbi:ATP phosphoribosyltransferase regulatory subunit [gamma proteobacterium HdN1]|nr:ATP phosphoribosyltransferase regulatory subunit [gamma proteobacterium HdN1]
MIPAERWLLPDGIEELLPPEAARLEQLRRKLLDLFRSWGYQQVFPSLVEYLDSLLAGAGNDLAQKTFHLTDAYTGKQMGIRADMTPQIARMDAHSLPNTGATRLCYAGHVLHAKPSTLAAPRALIQIGAELYGHSGIGSDTEIILLMLETLSQAELSEIFLDLGHVAIYRALAEQAGLGADAQWRLFEIFQRKAVPELEEFLTEHLQEEAMRQRFRVLPALAGDGSVLQKAREALAGAPAAVFAALDELSQIAAFVRQRAPAVTLYFDLGELRGYHYHTGPVFSAYMPGVGHAVASGGRYDKIGEVYGRARPATGFSMDLARLVKWSPLQATIPRRIVAPEMAIENAALWAQIQQLRREGNIVIQRLPSDHGSQPELGCSAQELGCQYELVCVEGRWIVALVDGARS